MQKSTDDASCSKHYKLTIYIKVKGNFEKLRCVRKKEKKKGVFLFIFYFYFLFLSFFLS